MKLILSSFFHNWLFEFNYSKLSSAASWKQMSLILQSLSEQSRIRSANKIWWINLVFDFWKLKKRHILSELSGASSRRLTLDMLRRFLLSTIEDKWARVKQFLIFALFQPFKRKTFFSNRIKNFNFLFKEWRKMFSSHFDDVDRWKDSNLRIFFSFCPRFWERRIRHWSTF